MPKGGGGIHGVQTWCHKVGQCEMRRREVVRPHQVHSDRDRYINWAENVYFDREIAQKAKSKKVATS
eukprot:3314919-Pleurochrysis_carterae.AAC.1